MSTVLPCIFPSSIWHNIHEVIRLHTLSSYTENVSELRRILKTDLNFDIQEKTFLIGGRAASLFFIEGMVKDEVLEKLLEFFHDLKPEQL